MGTLSGQLSHELEINVPPSKAWELYARFQLGKLAEAKLPNIEKIIVVEGDGGVGTVLEITYTPVPQVSLIYKEKFTKIDTEKRVKETEVIEGGYLDVGFTLYRVRFEVLTKEGDANSSIVRSTIEYNVKEEFALNAASVTIVPLQELAKLAADHLTNA
ncbi:hypothetical protein Droror1_Dr00009345 [Drosera rotundifolia]